MGSQKHITSVMKAKVMGGGQPGPTLTGPTMAGGTLVSTATMAGGNMVVLDGPASTANCTTT